jgi:hypothetical protein
MSKRPFHILSVEGQQKVGKTHLALTAPGPIAVQSLDFGTEGLVEKFESNKDIFVKEYDLAYDFTITTRGDQSEKQAAAIRNEYWKPFVDDAEEYFANFRTVIWDTATEVWEMLKLAYFGKLEKNPQLAYGPVNAEYKALVRLANTHRTNLVLLHQQGKVYKNKQDDNGKLVSIETDEWKRQGNNKIGNLVHSYVLQSFEQPVKDNQGNIKKPGTFYTEIMGARWAPEQVGLRIEKADWETLMSILHPHVEEWE